MHRNITDYFNPSVRSTFQPDNGQCTIRFCFKLTHRYRLCNNRCRSPGRKTFYNSTCILAIPEQPNLNLIRSIFRETYQTPSKFLQAFVIVGHKSLIPMYFPTFSIMYPAFCFFIARHIIAARFECRINNT